MNFQNENGSGLNDFFSNSIAKVVLTIVTLVAIGWGIVVTMGNGNAPPNVMRAPFAPPSAPPSGR